MGLLDKLWDDTVGGLQPDHGLGKLRKADFPTSPKTLQRSATMDSYPDSSRESSPLSIIDRRRSADFRANQEEARRFTQSLSVPKPSILERSVSVNSADSSADSPRASPHNQDVWRSVFHPGGYKNPVHGSSNFDKAEGKSPSIHDWSVPAPDWTTYVQSP